MKKLIESKVTLAVFFFMVGAITLSAFDRYRSAHTPNERNLPYGFNARDPSQLFSQIFNDEFFNRSSAPFEEMRRIESEMYQQFHQSEFFSTSFDRWYKNKFGGGDIDEVHQREDALSVYYDIEFKEQVPQNLKVEIKDNYIYIYGQSDEKKVERNVSSYESSEFGRSFPVPANIDASKYSIERIGNKVTVTFPKN